MKRAILWTAVSSQAQAQDDKISLALQERAGRDWCAANGYTVVGVLSVPGHSRSESDIITLFEDYARIGVYAYHDLRKLWQTRGFDVLVAYSKDRLARSATGITWVIENTIKSGALIYTTHDAGGGGWITPDNYRFSAAVGGLTVTSHVEQFQAKSAAARAARVARGIPLRKPNVPYTHTLICDDKGRPVRLELDSTKSRFVADLKDLLLQGVGWEDIEAALFERGHGRDGKPFGRHFVYALIHNPFFWGHAAMRYNTPYPGGQATNHWLYDASVPVPDDVDLHWNVGVPVWTGSDAAAVVAELKRRRIVTKGRGGSSKNYMFTGLMICGECGYHMVWQKDGAGNAYYRCRPNKRQPTRCTHNRSIAERKVVQFVQTALLERLKRFGTLPDAAAPAFQVDDIARQITDIEQRITRLIRSQAESDTPQVLALYDQQIRAYGAQLQHLQSEATRMEQAAESARQLADARRGALDAIREHMDDFWTLPSTRINQLMHQLLGDFRIEFGADRQLRLVKK